MSKFAEVDLWFTDQWDLDIDSSGDLKDTSKNYGRAILQEIRDRLNFKPGEWKLTTNIGCNLDRYIGNPATQNTIRDISAEIADILTFDRMLAQNDFEIIPLKLDDRTLIFRLVVFTGRGEIALNLGYDSDIKRFIGY